MRVPGAIAQTLRAGGVCPLSIAPRSLTLFSPQAVYTPVLS